VSSRVFSRSLSFVIENRFQQVVAEVAAADEPFVARSITTLTASRISERS
jgi:hypothetical protein